MRTGSVQKETALDSLGTQNPRDQLLPKQILCSKVSGKNVLLSLLEYPCLNKISSLSLIVVVVALS